MLRRSLAAARGAALPRNRETKGWRNHDVTARQPRREPAAEPSALFISLPFCRSITTPP